MLEYRLAALHAQMFNRGHPISAQNERLTYGLSLRPVDSEREHVDTRLRDDTSETSPSGPGGD